MTSEATTSTCIGFVTTYGYPKDTTPDRNSTNGIGAWDNKLSETSMAVSRDIEAMFRKARIKPLSKLSLVLSDGTTVTRTWDDRTAKRYKGRPLIGRFDFYYPSRQNPNEGKNVISFAKV